MLRSLPGAPGTLAPALVLVLACLFMASGSVGCGASGSYSPGYDASQGKDTGPEIEDIGPRPDKVKTPDVASSLEAGATDLPRPDDKSKPPVDTKPWPMDLKKPPKDLAKDTKPWPKDLAKDTKPWPKDLAKDTKPWPKDLAKDTKPWPKDSAPTGPDTWPTPTTCASVAGKPCTQAGNECGTAPNTCLLTSGGKGVCTCPCTVNNPQTPQNEDSCPQLNNNICGTVQMANGTTQNFCLRKCAPKLYGNDCFGSMACHPRSANFVSGSLNQAVCLLNGCATNSDCPVLNGKACSQGSPCPLGQLCIPHNSTTTHGVCGTAGSCDTVSNLCAPHNKGKPGAKVGDTCKADTDCGNNMRCRVEINKAIFQKKWNQSCGADGECCSGTCQNGFCTKGLCTVDNRNGYCVISGCVFGASLPTAACPSGSTCNILYTGGLCQRTCSLTNLTGCRGEAADRFGDYECRAWNNLNIGGTPLASAPVCDFGTGMTCDFLQASSLQCSSVGLTPNTTNMACRTLANSVTMDPYDPTGFCLDNTASSSQKRSPIPTP